ncbi:MAG: transcriptional regulator [Planctomycetota bacterium]|nr:MAG: transcriptional regulator [Planctomycetota bacterium]
MQHLKPSRGPGQDGKAGPPPADAAYSDAQLLLAARLYYVDGILQTKIGRMVGVSQAKVSRMLAAARQRGLVRITVPEFEPRDAALEQQLCRRLKLKHAVVVRQIAGQSPAESRNTLGYFAGSVAAGWLAACGTIAVAGGRTLQCLADSMGRQPGPAQPTIVQAMGNVDAAPGQYDGSEIGRGLAQRWRGNFLALNTPAFVPDASVCRRLGEMREIREVFERLASADAALVGIGNLVESVFIERRVLQPRDIQSLRRAGAVGEILGRFYNDAGKQCATPYCDRVISMALDKLRKIPLVVGVVAGDDRTEAIRAALRGGLINALVIDDRAARLLLESRRLTGRR